MIAKKEQPGKWHLIVDLSVPEDDSVNDGINPSVYLCSTIITVDNVIHMVSRYGAGALMVKFNVEAAYRNIAVHPSNYQLLGMQWHGHLYLDLALPFCLRSAFYF